MDIQQKIYPMQLNWPPALEDVENAPKDSSSMRLIAGVKNLKSLVRYQSLQNLWCFNVNEAALDEIGKCHSLKSLYIENIKTDRFEALLRLPNLEILSLETCSIAKSLGIFSEFHKLQGLAIIHFKNVRDLTPLAQLRNLEGLVVAGSTWTKMKVESLSPLEKLTALKHLSLISLLVEDESLGFLGNLKNLKLLNLANYYPMIEFALLSKKLPDTECTWFKPFNRINIMCKKCNQPNMVILTGKRKPSLCESCDRSRLEKHVLEWNKEVQNAA